MPQESITIHAYGGYANDTALWAQARVLEDEGIDHHEDDGLVKNIWHSIKRLESDEKSGVDVLARWPGGEQALRSDEEGYLVLRAAHSLGARQAGNTWVDLEYRMDIGSAEPFALQTQLLMPGREVDFVVVSDMDDTVIHTGVSSWFKWRLLVNSISKHAHRRVPLQGAVDLYQSLQRGPSGSGGNPFFYVSNSPWNLHGYLSAFLDKHAFPRGPLVLRDFGIKLGKSKGLEQGDKYKSIAAIMATYPDLDFVLIGDAAEHDAEIYSLLSEGFPAQVKAILIRAIGKSKQDGRLRQIIDARAHVPIYLIEDEGQGLELARSLGLVHVQK